MVVPHTVETFRTDARDILQQLISDHRMTPHPLLFGNVEASRLVEDRQRNVRLADVMQGCSYSEPGDIRAGEPEFQCERDRHSRYQHAVLERALVIAPDVVEPRAKPVTLDAIDDLRRGIFGIQQVDLSAKPNSG